MNCVIPAKLLNLVRSLDASALEALANKGLLRRAQKDLERGLPIQIERQDASTVYLAVDQFKVAIPEAGPAKARCSCPAAGVCQHILIAVLFLQRECPGVKTELGAVSALAAVEQELLAYSREQLESWCGKPGFRAALHLAFQPTAEIKAESGLSVRFPESNLQCFFAPGAGLDGIIVSGCAKDERPVAAAAVIAFQRTKGVAWEGPAMASAISVESPGAPRSRREVIETTQQLLNEMLDHGLARVSSALEQRLATLAVSATGVNLPRLALILRGLSDECALVLAREAHADLGRMLVRMAFAHALATALEHSGSDPRPDLVGWQRTHYVEVGHLDLIGVGAWPWRTASGYSGLTLLFWDTMAKRWNSWSESRPSQPSRDFQPVARYFQPGPWAGAESPRQLARGCFRLLNARRNSRQRLSGSSQSRVLVTGQVMLPAPGLPVISDWTQLLPSLESQVSVGLMDANRLNSIFVLKPAAGVQRGYDAVTQVFTWLLLDGQRRPLRLEMAFDAFSESAIQYLETVPAEFFPGPILIGRVQQSPRGLLLHPYSVHQPDGEVTHLGLDLATPGPSKKPETTDSEDEETVEGEDESASVMATSPILDQLLSDVDDALLAVAESGIAALNPLRLERVRQVALHVDLFPLPALQAGLKRLLVQPQANSLLRGYYLSQLHRQAMPLAVEAGLG